MSACRKPCPNHTICPDDPVMGNAGIITPIIGTISPVAAYFPPGTVPCPFCGETGFDLPGLKRHFRGGVFYGPCEAYTATETD